MVEQNQDVNENSSNSSALENAIASSPETIQQAQEAQSPTAEQGVVQEQIPQQEEEAKIPKSRLDEVIEQRNREREEKLWYRQQLERQQQIPQQPSQTIPEELGNTPEEREFYRLQRRIAREEAQKVAREQMQQVNPVFEATIREVSTLKVEQFRKDHPEIKRNSEEEREIAARISEASARGFTLSPEDAYWMVMGPRGLKSAAEKGKQEFKQKIETKKLANVETSNMPVNNPLPKGKIPLRQKLEEEADKLDWS